MPFSDYKIPIIVGKNDVPSISGDNHPNGSFVTEKYNALINDINSSINSINTQLTSFDFAEISNNAQLALDNLNIHIASVLKEKYHQEIADTIIIYGNSLESPSGIYSYLFGNNSHWRIDRWFIREFDESVYTPNGITANLYNLGSHIELGDLSIDDNGLITYTPPEAVYYGSFYIMIKYYSYLDYLDNNEEYPFYKKKIRFIIEPPFTPRDMGGSGS
ncbi:hypothetical protein [Geminocystis sp. GBBB08]|uniref:hypothetical protein n=1 Tax=Geminocystis sp. GBBB08 TaxID=2604140 RepID=UPI0027E31047|nr:hypothetical protein [Geminocystis sp. GBBB08]MBL1208262.1 hypothetical protein [Geminocystis sp. GBBB08]